jgi:transcriptional regulator GlxA family with amidase domain
MKMTLSKWLVFVTILIFSTLIFFGCSPIREFMTWKPYKGETAFDLTLQLPDKTKKNVIIIADNEGTEVFDMLAPFYLFNLSQEANVYIVAQKMYPIIVRKGFYILPQITYNQVDSLKIQPDLMIIPNLSAMDVKHQNCFILNWIKSHYHDSTKVLSVCQGALTASCTGLYDGKEITTHASEFEGNQGMLKNTVWVKDRGVVQSGNLFSTAGISHAVEGSLTLIEKMFGKTVCDKVMKEIHYPYNDIKLTHQSIPIHFNEKMQIGKKVFFKKNRRVGVLLNDEINELDLATVVDTYSRSFPWSIETYIQKGKYIKSKFGLRIFPTGQWNGSLKLDELHCFGETHFTEKDKAMIQNTEIINHRNTTAKYRIDECLERLEKQYGKKYQGIVKLMLDYN